MPAQPAAPAWAYPAAPTAGGLPWYRSTWAIVLATVLAFAVGGTLGAVAVVVSDVAQEAVEEFDDIGPDIRTYGVGGDLETFELPMGTCARFEIDDADELLADDVVDCGGRHAVEVYSVVQGPEGPEGAEGVTGPYEDDALAAFGDSGCYIAFEPFVGASYDDSSLDFYAVVPSAAEWRSGSRTIYCVLFHFEGEPLTGSARGSEI